MHVMNIHICEHTTFSTDVGLMPGVLRDGAEYKALGVAGVGYKMIVFMRASFRYRLGAN